ncbi:hypothetical protein SERLA73DRAFT_97769 [Serpula lacrymans var. lacrymans S7.3]|uniref:Gfo/Idh/MocA-like oxidoreductase N-terminal domain-containing protein n=2 Tax=Serpula lacrymans var. lacrymans TaxID=341189 RepID=F8QDY7_SERL3|nr:uncharacterized protein SERLADRAFT_364213 [Serpula lacrymans var. lacrymans S7.9]EGN93362.1 hypothetical protein SERLA73DRAFT_97769 [Serpula lacrymans var. lacrymans S7.3]EGO18743.1 hypothetical protein SERLADRAFT_364213 [Serpula lacrymans var. lacrymans S7.9]
MSTRKTSGFAMLGAGIYAKEAHVPALVSIGAAAFPLKAVYSRTESSSQALAREVALKLEVVPDVYHDNDPTKNLDSLLSRSDITAVNIVLPITLQPDIILKCFAAGKHVLSAKPIAPDVSESMRLIKIYETQYKPKGLVWRIAENFESEPGYITAGQIIRDGKIGKVIFFHVRAVNYMDKGNRWYKTPWRTIPDYQGGFLLDGGVHSTAALRVMLPGKMTHLSSFASLNKKYLPPHDTINAIVKVDDGSHGIFEMSFAAPATSLSQGNRIIITGTDGWLSVEQAKVLGTQGGIEIPVLRINLRMVTKVNDKPGPERTEIIDEPVKGVEAELGSFFAAVAGTRDDGLGSPVGALEDVAFIQAALNSEGCLVELQNMW